MCGLLHDRASGFVLAGSIEVIGGYIPVILHTAEEDLVSGRETPCERRSTIVPLPGSKGIVSCIAEALAQCDVIKGDVLALSIQVKQSASSVKHRAAWHTHRPARTSRNMGARERRSRIDKGIKVRCVYLVIAQFLDRIAGHP